jgi:hypothetical protein
VIILSANTEGEIKAALLAWTSSVPTRSSSTNPFIVTRAKLIAALAARHGLPAIYARREFAAAGCLMN